MFLQSTVSTKWLHCRGTYTCTKYRIDHCVVGCMTHYLLREMLSPVEAKEIPRAKPEVLQRLPREITFPEVDNGSYNPLRSDLRIYFVQCPSHSNKSW